MQWGMAIKGGETFDSFFRVVDDDTPTGVRPLNMPWVAKV